MCGKLLKSLFLVAFVVGISPCMVMADNLVQGGDFGDASDWILVEHTVPAVTIMDPNYMDDAPVMGEAPCLRLASEGNSEARPIVYQKLNLIAGRQYKIDAALKVVGIDPIDPAGTWIQIYMSTEEPPPAGETIMDWNPPYKLFNVDAWDSDFDLVVGADDLFSVINQIQAKTPQVGDGTGLYIPPGEAGTEVDIYLVIKPGQCCREGSFDLLFDNVSVTEVPFVKGGDFTDASTWTLVEHTVPAVTTMDPNYMDDAPVMGEAPCLRLATAGNGEARPIVYQKLRLIAGQEYRVDAALKVVGIDPIDPAGTWIQIYMSTEEPPPAGETTMDWNPPYKFFNVDAWDSDFDLVVGADDLFSVINQIQAKTPQVGDGTGLYIPPGEAGDEVDIYLVIKPGQCCREGSFDLLFDNVSVTPVEHIVKNGTFDDASAWTLVEHTVPAVTTIDAAYMDDAPVLGEAPCLRLATAGNGEARPVIYQKLTLIAGADYWVDCALKVVGIDPIDPAGTWIQIYMSTEEPPPAGETTMDWNPPYKLFNVDAWDSDFELVVGADDLFSVINQIQGKTPQVGDGTGLYTAPIPDGKVAGDKVDIYLVIKPGQCCREGSFDLLFDNVSVTAL